LYYCRGRNGAIHGLKTEGRSAFTTLRQLGNFHSFFKKKGTPAISSWRGKGKGEKKGIQKSSATRPGISTKEGSILTICSVEREGGCPRRYTPPREEGEGGEGGDWANLSSPPAQDRNCSIFSSMKKQCLLQNTLHETGESERKRARTRSLIPASTRKSLFL